MVTVTQVEKSAKSRHIMGYNACIFVYILVLILFHHSETKASVIEIFWAMARVDWLKFTKLSEEPAAFIFTVED